MAGFKYKYSNVRLRDLCEVKGAKLFAGALLCILLSISANPALAATSAQTITDIAENTTGSLVALPALISVASYLLALLFGVTGILKLKDHVENPNNTPIRVPIIRFIAGGALLALPIVYEAMRNTINSGNNIIFDASVFTPGNFLSKLPLLLGNFLNGITGGAVNLADINGILSNIIMSIEGLPAIIAVIAYLLGLLFGVTGILKLKDHVENPDQNPLKEGVIRLIVGGALFAIPNVYAAMGALIGGDLSIISTINNVLGAARVFYSSYSGTICTPAALIGNSFGDAVCGIITHTGSFSAFLNVISYIFGLVLGLWGILKIKEHVTNPQTSIWEGVSRLFAGGAFFALPIVVETLRATIATPLSSVNATFLATTGYTENASSCGVPASSGGGADAGLDVALYCFMHDTLGPIHVVLNFFSFVAGMILIMIGISRLMKGAQEGAKAPGGLGTMMTFLAGGALISYNELIRAFTSSLSMGGFGGGVLFATTATKANLAYNSGLTNDEIMHVHTVISAILKFMIVVGLISFVRGIFIVRNVAEGNGQASLMAGVTHMVGGALAVNLGPLINVVQATLGITGYGITFS